ncbi:hypothetical protein LFM09_16730 [Lentzea alba]|uniref:hypothetical protein n=1 Tax=Lentzea alba TaxID=2714351 RepID=UPI0039BED3EF
MMEAARRDLTRMRESTAAWRELRYSALPDGQDEHEVRRAKVLWALQYDRRTEDLPLLRFLAEQEALCRRHAPFQGLGSQAELVGFLLAEHRQVEDVWRQHAIKRANFDTWCGYDREHLFAAGVEATVAYVQDHPDRDDVLELVVDEDDLEPWAESRREWFPEDPADEDPLTWVERALLAGERELARAELDRWAADRPRDLRTLDALHHHLTELGAFAEAARAQRDALAFVEGDRDRAPAWLTLAGLERQAGEHRAAWEALRECRTALDGVEGWQEIGLGLRYVEELFLLSGQAERELAGEVFAQAHREAEGVDLSLVICQAAVAAAGHVGDEIAVRRYEKLRDAEQERISSGGYDYDED